jgi:glutamine synthetase
MDTIVEYIWLDSDYNFRSKTRILSRKLVVDICQIPEWNYDGSSTNQASTEKSEIVLKPVFLCNDPFRYNNHKIVYCGTYDLSGVPLSNNHFDRADDVFHFINTCHYRPWFGMEQEFVILDESTGLPINYDENDDSKHYCSIDNYSKRERDIMEDFMKRAMHSELNICGINAEVSPGQWEFQIGPCEGITIGHHVMMARYILSRVAHRFSCRIDYSPKPLGENKNGSGCHVNYSTTFTRLGDEKRSGLDFIYKYIESLSKVHSEMIKCYGDENEKRLSGNCETAHYNEFTHSVGGRNTSIRIANNVFIKKCGYFEDRRPAANCDPYLVSSLMFYHTCTKHD